MNPWIAIIGTLAGALIGGGLALLNAHFQLQRQAKRERQKLLLSKLEEIFELLSRIRKAYSLTSLQIVFKLSGTDAAQHTSDETLIPIERLQLLIGFYAPTLSGHLEKLEQHRNEFGELLAKSILWDKRDDKAKKEIFQAIEPGWRKLDKACAEMQEHVLLLSKQYL
jgi:gas vesicle protein